MRKQLRYILSSIFMLTICFVLVGCKAHENKSYLVDGEEIIGDEIDHIPNNITFKKNASVGSTVKINASLVPSTATGKIYVVISSDTNLVQGYKDVGELYYLKRQYNSSIQISYSNAKSFILTYKAISNSPFYLLFYSKNNGTYTDLLASCKVDFEKKPDLYFSFDCINTDYNDPGDYSIAPGSVVKVFDYFDYTFGDIGFFRNSRTNLVYGTKGTVGNDTSYTTQTSEVCLTSQFVSYCDSIGYQLAVEANQYIENDGEQDWGSIEMNLQLESGIEDVVDDFNNKYSGVPFLMFRVRYTCTYGYNKTLSGEASYGVCYR